MANVSADNVVEKVGVDETEVPVNCSSRSARECPLRVLVVGKTAVRVLKIGNGN